MCDKNDLLGIFHPNLSETLFVGKISIFRGSFGVLLCNSF